MFTSWVFLGCLSGAWAESPALIPDGLDKSVPTRNYDILGLHLDVDLDVGSRSISGTATYTVQQLQADDFVLDQVALNIESVTVDAEEASFRTPGHSLVIDMPDRITRGGQAKVKIAYSATPRKGLFFRERNGLDSYAEVWTQGQKNDNRYWFPAWDHPNDRFEYTGTVTGPAGWKVKTNSGMNLPSYLIMIAAGPYKEMGGPENRVWAGPRASDRGMRRVLDPVPDMMEHFKERTGVAYPWGEFLQVFVQRFMYGGMENTAATINTDDVVTGEPVDVTQDRIQSLVAHELAHQWYGDYLTCRSWRDLWLNEGFATFFAADWMARRDGPERWAKEALKNQKHSQWERAVAGRFFHGPEAGANHNVYAKGSTVLQLLRVMLGEDVFWAGIRHYTTSHAKSLVRTHDLQESMEAVSGRELGWFFQQWVELPHVPRLTVSSGWKDGTLTLTVKQKVTDARPAYTIPFEVEVGGPDGPVLHKGVLVDEKLQLQVEVAAEPTYVAFDPRAGVLSKLTNEQADEAWVAQLSSPHPAAVFRAIKALGDTSVSEPLVTILSDTDEHPLIRAAVAAALGQQRRSDLLLVQAKVSHDRVRWAVIQALGRGVDGAALPVLERAFRTDKNPDIRRAAMKSVKALSPKRGAALARKALGDSYGALAREASSILGEHGELSDVSRLVSLKMRSTIRTSGVRAAAKIVRRSDKGGARDAAATRITGVLVRMLDDVDFRARQSAVSLLGSVGDKSAISHLERFRRIETVDELTQAAREAVSNIRSRGDDLEEAGQDNETAAKLKDLETRIDEMEDQFQSWMDQH
jgi:aminopeptidase N